MVIRPRSCARVVVPNIMRRRLNKGSRLSLFTRAANVDRAVPVQSCPASYFQIIRQPYGISRRLIALPQPDLPEKMLLGNVFSLYLHIKNNLIAFVFVSELSVK